VSTYSPTEIERLIAEAREKVAQPHEERQQWAI
jgi:hypothetical protein